MSTSIITAATLTGVLTATAATTLMPLIEKAQVVAEHSTISEISLAVNARDLNNGYMTKTFRADSANELRDYMQQVPTHFSYHVVLETLDNKTAVLLYVKPIEDEESKNMFKNIVTQLEDKIDKTHDKNTGRMRYENDCSIGCFYSVHIANYGIGKNSYTTPNYEIVGDNYTGNNTYAELY